MKINKYEITPRPYKSNKYKFEGDVCIGMLKDGTEFIFDTDDYEKISKYYWSLNSNGYVFSNIMIDGKRYNVFLHVLIFGNKNGFEVDHIDRNKLNNRKNNLIYSTHSENNRNKNKQINNSSGIIGVYKDSQTGQWRAQIKINNKTIALGRFINKEDAIVARLKAEYLYYENFAPQECLFEEYNIKSYLDKERCL